MSPTAVFRIILLVLLIICAIAVNLTRNLLNAVIIFMSYSSIMCLLWILMESPDLAITEAAVGAGISGTLFMMTLKKIRSEDAGEGPDETPGLPPEGAGTASETDSETVSETASKAAAKTVSGAVSDADPKEGE